MSIIIFFFFNDTATTEIYTLSLHDALPICPFGAIEVSNNLAKIDPAKCKNCQLCVVVCPTKAIYTGLNRPLPKKPEPKKPAPKPATAPTAVKTEATATKPVEIGRAHV